MFKTSLLAFAMGIVPMIGHADTVTDWNWIASETTLTARMTAPDASRVVAISSATVADALNAISGKYQTPLRLNLDRAPNASVDATVAAATHVVLLKFIPTQQVAIEATYLAELAKTPDSDNKKAGVALGKKAADAVIKDTDSGFLSETYRPFTEYGKYVPTAMPIRLISAMPQRKT